MKRHSKSQTTAMLYQHPVANNTIKYKSKSGLVLASIIIITMCLGGLFSCTGYQHAVATIGGTK